MSRSASQSVTELAHPSEGRPAAGSLQLKGEPPTGLHPRISHAATDASTNAVLVTHKTRRSDFIKELGCHVTVLLAGWSDASAGPLIPYIQRYYGISYTVVSLMFIGQMVGFFLAGLNNATISRRLGLGATMTLGAAIQALGYALLIPAFPFPVLPVCYGIVGFGLALQDAQANVYIGSLPNASHKFAILHSCYGLGGVVVPLAATAFASAGIRFSYFYSISIGLEAINIIVLLAAFKLKFRLDDAGCEQTSPVSDPPIPLEAIKANALERDVESDTSPRTASPVLSATAGQPGTLLEALRSVHCWLFAAFIFVSVGAGVSLGGWIVTYLMDERGGGSSSGYVATVMWAGCLVGRLGLSWLNMRVGEKRVLYLYLLLSIGLELVIWFARDFIGDAVAVAVIGVLMGPAYPLVMSIATKVIPRRLHPSAIGLITAFAQAGGALCPFVTALLLQRFSPMALQPVMVTLFAIQVCIWFFVPTPQRKLQ